MPSKCSIAMPAVSLLMLLVIGCGDAGIGQAFDSPDGRFTASATPYFGKKPRTEYRIKDKQTGKVLWNHTELTHGSDDPPYGAGFGNFEYIQWSGDSHEVRFAVKCTDTTKVVQWMSVSSGEQPFDTSVRCDAGLRPEDRTQR